MSRIEWATLGTRSYEAGVDRGVFYPQVGPGLPWNGLISVKEDPAGGEPQFRYYDGQRYLDPQAPESFAAVLQAFTCPREFEDYDGTSGRATAQGRRRFGLSYRTGAGNDISEDGYKIHLVYNALAMPAAFEARSMAPDSTTPAPFSWGISTSPVFIPGLKPSAHIIIDPAYAYPSQIAVLEEALYGSDGVDAGLPSPQELYDLVEPLSILVITDHGDGSWTATGPDDVVSMIDADTFQIDWPSAIWLDEDTFQVSSL